MRCFYIIMVRAGTRNEPFSCLRIFSAPPRLREDRSCRRAISGFAPVLLCSDGARSRRGAAALHAAGG